MSHDLFLALKDPDNRRGHPILAALLYAFCPAAAHWWRQGAQPDPPFNLVWQVLADRASGRPLAEALKAYGFETLIDDVRDYIERVRHYRGQNHRALAPET